MQASSNTPIPGHSVCSSMCLLLLIRDLCQELFSSVQGPIAIGTILWLCLLYRTSPEGGDSATQCHKTRCCNCCSQLLLTGVLQLTPSVATPAQLHPMHCLCCSGRMPALSRPQAYSAREALHGTSEDACSKHHWLALLLMLPFITLNQLCALEPCIRETEGDSPASPQHT